LLRLDRGCLRGLNRRCLLLRWRCRLLRGSGRRLRARGRHGMTRDPRCLSGRLAVGSGLPAERTAATRAREGAFDHLFVAEFTVQMKYLS